MDIKEQNNSSKKDYSKMKDEDLIEIIKSGDKFALEYLINRYYDARSFYIEKIQRTCKY